MSSQLVALASVGTPGDHLGPGPRAVLGGAETPPTPHPVSGR